MKRTKLLTVLSALFLLAGCGNRETGTKFYEKWDYDDEYHWHNAIGDSDEISGKAEHNLGDIRIDDEGKEYRLCSVCLKRVYGGGSGAHTGVDKNGFTNVSRFDEEVEIHTPNQLKFLTYEGSYETIASNLYPNGDKTNSNPVQTDNQEVKATKATVTWDYANHTDSVTYSVSISQKADMSDSFEIKGTNEKSLDLYNFYLGKNYYQINAKDGDDVTSSGVYELTVKEDGPRNLYVGTTMTNCRDCGGRATEAGGKVKQGLLYRTCGNGYTTKSARVRIDDLGKEIMLNQLKVKTELNCSDNTNYNFTFGSAVKIYDTLMDYGGSAKHHFSRNAESVKNVFEILAKESSYPVFFHCRIGTDRTGLLGNLILGLLGVPLNMIYQDYLFSNFGNIENKRYIGSQAGEDDITRYMKEVEAMKGETFQEKTYNTLLSIGVPSTTLDKVINILTDGTKPNNGQGQVIKTVDDMSLSGTQKRTESKTSLTARNNPASYAIMSNNATATATFTATGDKNIYAYLGNSDNSTSKYINASLEVTVDGNKIAIPSTSFKEAGMGNCNNRVNYYFVKLGEVKGLADAEHTIVIKGVGSASLNLGLVTLI